MKVVLTLILFLSLLSKPTFSQNINTFKNFTADHPLSYQAVRTIAQDKESFIWFGSQEGVHRYDGHQFLSFHHDANDPTSLSSDVISRILIDSSKQIWVATRGGGLNLFRENSQDFQRITSKTSPLSLTNDNVNALIEDKLGNLWIGTENGVNILFRDGNNWQIKHIVQELGNPNSLSYNSVETILQTANGQVWVGTGGGGISVFDQQGNFIQSVNIRKKQKQGSAEKLIKVLYQDNMSNIWVGTSESGLFKFSSKDNNVVQYQFDEFDTNSLMSNSIESIYQDSSDRIWVASDKGIAIFNEELNNFSRINHSVTNPQSLTNDFVLTIFEDNKNMIWIGTFSGVSRWDPNMTTFRQYNDQNHPKVARSLIMDFAQLDKDHIIFSTYANGLYVLTIEDNTIAPFKFNISNQKLRFTSLLVDNDTLWLGSRSSGLFEINLVNGKSKNYRFDSSNHRSISANSITDIFKDSKARLWVSTYHKGLNKLNRNGTFERFESKKPLSQNSPSTNHILQIAEDKQGDIWLATYDGGINRFNPDSKTFTHITHDENIKNSLSSDIAWVMLFDQANNLWVGTQAAGLNLLSNDNILAENYSFQYFDIKNGMKDQTVYGFSQDSAGNLWFSSNKGISRYSLKHNSFKHFDTRHGLVDLEYNHGAVFSGSDDTLYFGSAKGFTSVDPKNILTEQPAPEVRLTNIFKLNEAMEFKQGLSNVKSLTFDYSDQLISFEYVGLNYSDPESTRYKYRLLGFDDEWIDAGKLKRATYTNLPSGNYTLQIVAGNSDNVWSDPGYAIEISVNSAPWNTWWAYLLYVVFIALSVLSYTRILNRKLVIEQQQKISLKKQVIEKTQDYAQKNSELEQANNQLEKAATVDKLTGVKSRRYLDIYIEQTSQLMNQIHQNILPVQRSILPRLYLLMIRIANIESVKSSQLINLTDLLLYSRNPDDLVIRWSDDTFAIIGYEKDNNAGELAARLANRYDSIFDGKQVISQAYSFYPFNREQPLDLSWDQVSVMTEMGLNIVNTNDSINWLGLCKPKVQPFDYLEVVKDSNFAVVKQHVVCKQG
ncbi:two-component regulator propeller domain-containing protein [Thalassotalea nanhaiensis]|uniref:Two-component regulator propeller domain-containing protein n=1 Tax=Thalassotalea nanhaiensis TaxID=3065648 RepID=A0ABY9TLG9_9GAMM|nr:two-component regulator propeller domain-containing protein [Colwelliaceae bacterium SQ345]